MKKVFCIGNGGSRKNFDLESLRGKGRIYGCNALYRDFKPDVLISVDNGIMHEIYQSGFSKEVECWFRNWTKVPAGHYEMMLHAGLSIGQVEEVKKEWDGLYENDKGNATELIIGGHMINAQEAFRIGLANKVFEQDKLMEETKNFANTILGNGPDSIAESLRCINESAGHSLIDGLNLEVEAFSKRFGTDETNEGLDAFVEKREANFRN